MWDNSWLAYSGHIIQGEPASRHSTILLFHRFLSYFNLFLRRGKTRWVSEFIIFSFFLSLFLFYYYFFIFLLLYNFII